MKCNYKIFYSESYSFGPLADRGCTTQMVVSAVSLNNAKMIFNAIMMKRKVEYIVLKHANLFRYKLIDIIKEGDKGYERNSFGTWMS